MSGIARLVFMNQRAEMASASSQLSFFSSKGLRIKDMDLAADSPNFGLVLDELASRSSDPVAADAWRPSSFFLLAVSVLDVPQCALF